MGSLFGVELVKEATAELKDPKFSAALAEFKARPATEQTLEGLLEMMTRQALAWKAKQ